MANQLAEADPFVPVEGSDSDLDALIRQPRSIAPMSPASVSMATLVGFDLLERPLLRRESLWPGEIVPARTTVALRQTQCGGECVLVFEEGDLRLPVVIGLLQPQPNAAAQPPDIQSDPDRTEIVAERELVLRCGDASLTLTRGGKVLIRGQY